MSIKESGVLLILAAIWGASFMFIKVGGEEMGPFALVEMRLALAGVAMIIVSATQRGIFAEMRRRWPALLLLGLINCAIPYTLITWGEVYISSGLAAIYNACAPLWAAAILLIFPSSERPTPTRLVGLLVGMAGVVLVVSSNLDTRENGWLYWLGQGACVLAALSYALSGIYARKALQGAKVQVGATGQLVAGALMILPLAAFQVPQHMPSWLALGAVSTLALAGTALASMIYYWLVARIGATGVLLVTYLLPAFALVWGALLLSEQVTALAVLGLLLVLLGVGITSGTGAQVVNRLRKRPPAAGTVRET